MKIYGKEKLKQAMSVTGISCGCLIATVDFLGELDKAEGSLRCTVQEMKALMERVPGLKRILDTGNIFVGDHQADLLNYYEQLKPYIVRVHLKDVVRGHFPGKEKCVDGLSIAPVVTGSGILPMTAFQQKLWTAMTETSASSTRYI